jgi:hypothetical protein
MKVLPEVLMAKDCTRAEIRYRGHKGKRNHNHVVEASVPSIVRDLFGARKGDVLVFEKGNTTVAEKASVPGPYFVVTIRRKHNVEAVEELPAAAAGPEATATVEAAPVATAKSILSGATAKSILSGAGRRIGDLTHDADGRCPQKSPSGQRNMRLRRHGALGINRTSKNICGGGVPLIPKRSHTPVGHGVSDKVSVSATPSGRHALCYSRRGLRKRRTHGLCAKVFTETKWPCRY